jgi:hypothetical protein
MDSARTSKIIRISAAAVTGLIALSAYAGAVGLVGGGISFGDTIDARLPFGRLILAGLALLAFVALPMTVAALAAAKNRQHSSILVFAAGLLLVMWIAVERRADCQRGRCADATIEPAKRDAAAV